MPFGTACARLRKSILFHLLKQLGQNICYRCECAIDNIDELTIDHKIGWLDNPDLFWDLENIAFSHSLCNSKQGGMTPVRKRWNYVEKVS